MLCRERDLGAERNGERREYRSFYVVGYHDFFSHALILSVAYGEKETRKEDIPQGLWRMSFICDIVESIDLA